jgi:hypothetical protein
MLAVEAAARTFPTLLVERLAGFAGRPVEQRLTGANRRLSAR